MDIKTSLAEKLRLATKLFQHKILQYRLSTNETHVLKTNYGQVRGKKRRTLYDDEEYYAFEGIPFAKPPVGELRFRAPQEPEPWNGIMDCTNYKNKPLQRHMVVPISEGSEDCLYLNVYVKQLQSEKPLPVMVWIYGGGFQVGEATRELYAPDYFMKEDVILVTFNYRLGALGFLSLSDPDIGVPGNAGLKDQVMALRWVKNNIKHFNGDEDNITLFGESAGGASTHLMMLTPKTKGLFHKAILQSGCALNTWAYTPNRNWGYRLAVELGYKGSNNDKEVFRYLSKLDGPKISSADNRLLTIEERRDRLIISFGPVVEPYDGEDCILPKPYKELLKTAWSNEIPIILGGTSSEGLFSYQDTVLNPWLLSELGDCEDVLPSEVREHLSPEEAKQLGLKIKRAHFGDKEPSVEETLLPYLDLITHKLFWHGISRTLQARRAYAQQAPTYLYRFDFDSADFNLYRMLKCGRSVRGVCHADDLFFLFHSLLSWKLPKESAAYKTIERMIGMWTAFARTSNPNCAEIAPTLWAPVKVGSSENSTPKCLNISEKVEYIDMPEKKKLDVWDSLYTEVSLY